MFAAIPYLALPLWKIQLAGRTIPLDPWAILVCTGFVVGLEIARARAIKLGLDIRDIVDGALFIVGSGFLWGHIITVVAYYPQRLKAESISAFFTDVGGNGLWSILRVWEGFSSFGGFLGAVLGSILFFKVIRKRDYFRMVDVIVYGFPFAWFFGRLGCGMVHDHIGRLSSFPLAMDFDRSWTPGPDPDPTVSGIRHELGLYEAMFMVLVSILFYFLGRKDRAPGFYLGLYAVVYAPVRFTFDFLRNTDLGYHDARYLGLTPAQYGSIFMLGLGIWILYSRNWSGFRPWPMDGGPDQEKRALEQANALS